MLRRSQRIRALEARRRAALMWGDQRQRVYLEENLEIENIEQLEQTIIQQLEQADIQAGLQREQREQEQQQRVQQRQSVVSNEQINYVIDKSLLLKDIKRQSKQLFIERYGNQPNLREIFANHHLQQLVEIAVDDIDQRNQLLEMLRGEREDVNFNIQFWQVFRSADSFNLSRQWNFHPVNTNIGAIISRIMTKRLRRSCSSLFVRNQNRGNREGEGLLFWCCNSRSRDYHQYATDILRILRNLINLNIHQLEVQIHVNRQEQVEVLMQAGTIRLMQHLLKEGFCKDYEKAWEHFTSITRNLNLEGQRIFRDFFRQLERQNVNNHNRFVNHNHGNQWFIPLLDSRQQLINYLREQNLISDSFVLPFVSVHDINLIERQFRANDLNNNEWRVICAVIGGLHNEDWNIENPFGKHAEQMMLQRLAEYYNSSNPIESFDENTYFQTSMVPCPYCFLIIHSCEMNAQLNQPRLRRIVEQYPQSGYRFYRAQPHFNGCYHIPLQNGQNEEQLRDTAENISAEFINIYEDQIQDRFNLFQNLIESINTDGDIPAGREDQIRELLLPISRKGLSQRTSIREDIIEDPNNLQIELGSFYPDLV